MKRRFATLVGIKSARGARAVNPDALDQGARGCGSFPAGSLAGKLL